jgi:broad specificity phosphatase PhoE
MTLPLFPKSFYFIRHGESEWNKMNKFAGGQIDTILTDLGREKALDRMPVFNKLSPMPTHIIHSTLSRAADTAAILNQDRNIPMIANYNLREIDAGEWAGMDNHEVKQKWIGGFSAPNGESLNDFAIRIQKAFNEILSKDDYSTPLIVAHGRIVNAIDTIYKIPMRSLQVQNCEILKFIPSTKNQYPWDVYKCDLRDGKIIEELTDWSQT